mgnify:CR=1 FL=1
MLVRPSNSATPTLAVTGIWCSASIAVWRRSAFTMPSATTSACVGVDLGQDDPELVAAQPRQDVGLADPAAQRRGDGLEQVVAGFVAELVVDRFEVIQIEQQHGAAAAIAGRGLGLLGQRLLEAPAVEQRRQKIVIDEVLQTPFELFALGDVLHLRDEVQRSALVVADERHAQQHPDQMAPGVSVSLLDLIAVWSCPSSSSTI